ncbi:MAG: hypothetical protein H5U22_06255 [Rhizobium sp.]|nr:hypothetical protein [Rhizobium sp.]
MSIRLRTVDGVRVALCGYETDAMEGDTYLDDSDHCALVAKFSQDYCDGIWGSYPDEWSAMESQKVRDAKTRFDEAA